MIKLLISDLDHTLLNDKKKVDPRVQASIQKLIESGIDIGLASGRTDGDIKQISHQYLQYPCHRISENGVFVYTANGERLFSTALPLEVIQPILEKAQSYSFQIIFNAKNQSYVLRKTDELVQYEKRSNMIFHENPHLLDHLSGDFPLTKIAVVGELAELKQFELDLEQHFVDKINFFISSPDCLDMIPKHTSKGRGLQVLMEQYQIKPEEVACVGDSYNDISMFQITPHSFAMAHGEKQVRDAANHTVQSVTEVADYIYKYKNFVSQ